ncbi:MAG: ABC transporter permease [Ktedonobacteraceae bacterium]
MLVRKQQPKKPRATRFVPVSQAAAEESTVVPAHSPSPPAHSPVADLLRELQSGKTGRDSSFGASWDTAVESVWANRTRSLLTMLGIVIGIAAVIGALTLAQGVGAFFTNLISSQGANTITVQPGTLFNTTQKKSTIRDLSQQDLLSISRLQHVIASSPIVSAGNGQAVYGTQNWNTRTQGVSIDIETIQNWNMAEGIWFTQADEAGAQPVAVIGDTVKHNLFDPTGTDPVGKKIRFRSQVFRIVGVLAPKGGLRQDDVIFVPYKAAEARLTNTTALSQIIVQVDAQENLDVVVQQLTSAIEQNHRIARGSPDDFKTTTSTQTLQRAQQTTGAISLLLSGIAAISLTVGGIGIMNIMLVSVTERTREIGLRMAIGARRRDIRNQFLVESLVLCLLGGVLGLALGLFVGWLSTGVLLSAIAGSAGNVPFIVTPTTLILPFAVSLIIGVVFGLYPAVRASRLDPIVALRRAR